MLGIAGDVLDDRRESRKGEEGGRRCGMEEREDDLRSRSEERYMRPGEKEVTYALPAWLDSHPLTSQCPSPPPAAAPAVPHLVVSIAGDVQRTVSDGGGGRLKSVTA